MITKFPSAQILLTTIVSVITVFYPPINLLLRGNSVLLLFLIFLQLLLFLSLLFSIISSSIACISIKFPRSAILFIFQFFLCQCGCVVNSGSITFYYLICRRCDLKLIFCVAVLIPLLRYQQKHPHNYILLGLFTLSISFTVRVTCANTDGKIVLEALILTSAVFSSLTGYAFWASKKGKDFNYLGPLLFTCLFTLLLTGMMQKFFPLGPTTHAIYGGIGAMIFSAYLVYDTDNLIKRFTYDEYIGASVTLYLDILNLFLSILRVLREANN